MLLLVLEHLCALYDIQSGSITIGCDNKGVLHHVHHPSTYVLYLFKHADLIQAIHSIQRHCPVHLAFQYVAGHQDEFVQFEDLPPLAQLNMQANIMAKQALVLLGERDSPLSYHHYWA